MSWQVGNLLSETDYSRSCLIADEQRHLNFMLMCLQSREALDLLKKTGNRIFAAGGKLWFHSDKPVGRNLHDFVYEMSNNHPQVARLAIRARVLPNVAQPDPNMICGCYNCDPAVRDLEQTGDKIYFLANRVTHEQGVVVAGSAQEACAKRGWFVGDTYIKEIRT